MRPSLLSRSLLALALSTFGGSRALRADDPPPAPAPEPAGPDINETRGYIGYRPGFVQGLEAAERKELGITRKAGLFVASLTTDGPAAKAGLKLGDVILKIKGQDVSDAEKVLPKDEEDGNRWLNGAFKTITSTVKPGEEVEMVLDRGGKSVTVKPVAIPLDEMKKLTEADQEEADSVKVPSPDAAGDGRAYAYDFEKVPEDLVRPESVLSVTGMWEVTKDAEAGSGGKENHVLNQSSDLGENFAMVVAHEKGLSHADATASVRLRFVRGEKSVSGGIAFRVRDRKNWYAVVADGVQKKLQVLVMKKLTPTVLASADLGSPKLKAWHTLEVKVVGDAITATFDGTVKVAAKDGTIKETGWFGLVTRGDAETDFDDWKFDPATK
jgi:hypothetical protein